MDTILRCTVTIILAASVYFPGVYQTYTGRSIMWTDVKYGRFQTTSRLLSLNGTGKDAINGSASVQVLQSAYFEIKTALTFDFDDSLVFWGEIVGGAIYKMDLLTNDIRSIYSNNHSSVTSLSADWLAKKLYWTDSFFNWIKVSDYNGTYHRTLVHTGKQFVGGIVVNPLSGYMYWSEREQEPRIEMATLTGENRRSLVYNISYFQRPQGLTIDFNENRLFWVDIELSLLSSISLSDSSANPLYHSVGEYLAYYLDVDSEFFFLSGTLSKQVYIQSRFNPAMRTQMTFQHFNPLSLIVYDGARQPRAQNPCTFQNGGCQQICASYPGGYKCLCEDGFVVDEGEKDCILYVPTHAPIVDSGNSLSLVHIAGIVLGSVVLSFILLVLICYFYRRIQVTRDQKSRSVGLKWVTVEQRAKSDVEEDDCSLSDGADESSKQLKCNYGDKEDNPQRNGT